MKQINKAPEEEYYTIKEVAHIFRVSSQTIRNWIKQDKIGAIQIVKRGRIRIPKTEVPTFARKK